MVTETLEESRSGSKQMHMVWGLGYYGDLDSHGSFTM